MSGKWNSIREISERTGMFSFNTNISAIKFNQDIYDLVTTVSYNMYRLHHEVEVGMGFTQPRAEGPRIV